MRKQLEECVFVQLVCLLENRNGSYQSQSEELFGKSRATHEFSACSRNPAQYWKPPCPAGCAEEQLKFSLTKLQLNPGWHHI